MKTIIMMLLVAAAGFGQAQSLSDDEVTLALSGKGMDHVAVLDNGLSEEIILYMPEALLAIRRESAKKQFTQYQPSEEDKRRSLMIIAKGYQGGTIAEGCTSITRVVLLSDPTGRVVQEAYQSEPNMKTMQNSFGARIACQDLWTKFSLDDVRKVRAAASNGEFFVAVFSGTVKTKTYKVKKKHQSAMGL